MEQAGKRSWWLWALAGAVALALGCVVVTLVGGGAAFWLVSSDDEGSASGSVESAPPAASEAPAFADPNGRMSMAAVPEGWDTRSSFAAGSGYVVQEVKASPDLDAVPGTAPNVTVVQAWPKTPGEADPQTLVDRPWETAEGVCSKQAPASFAHPRLGSGHVVRWVDCSDAADERIRSVFPQSDGSVLLASATVFDERDRDYYRRVLDTLEFQPAPPPPAERVCSAESGDNLPFQLANNSAEPVRVFWYDGDCRGAEERVLLPGATMDSDGPLGREWRAYSMDGTKTISSFAGSSESDATWDIR